MLFSAYRTDQFADPEGFVAQCAVTFGDPRYSIETVEYLCDPRNSAALQCKHKWPPTIAEIREALDEETEKREKIAANTWVKPKHRHVREIQNHPGCRCNLFVHADAPQYPTVKAWSESDEADVRDYKADPDGRPGIWVAYNIYNDIAGGRLRGWKTPSYAEQLANIGNAEIEAEKAAKEFKEDHRVKT